MSPTRAHRRPPFIHLSAARHVARGQASSPKTSRDSPLWFSSSALLALIVAYKLQSGDAYADDLKVIDKRRAYYRIRHLPALLILHRYVSIWDWRILVIPQAGLVGVQ